MKMRVEIIRFYSEWEIIRLECFQNMISYALPLAHGAVKIRSMCVAR